MGTVGERAVSAPIRNATVMALLCFGKDDTGFGRTPLLHENRQLYTMYRVFSKANAGRSLLLKSFQ